MLLNCSFFFKKIFKKKKLNFIKFAQTKMFFLIRFSTIDKEIKNHFEFSRNKHFIVSLSEQTLISSSKLNNDAYRVNYTIEIETNHRQIKKKT